VWRGRWVRCAAGSDEADAATAAAIFTVTNARTRRLVVCTLREHSACRRRRRRPRRAPAPYPQWRSRTRTHAHVPRTQVVAAAFVLQHYVCGHAHARTVVRALSSAGGTLLRCMRFESSSRRRGRIFHTVDDVTTLFFLKNYLFMFFRFHIIVNVTK